MNQEDQQKFDNLCKLASLRTRKFIEAEVSGKKIDMSIEENLLSDEDMEKVRTKLLELIKK